MKPDYKHIFDEHIVQWHYSRKQKCHSKVPPWHFGGKSDLFAAEQFARDTKKMLGETIGKSERT